MILLLSAILKHWVSSILSYCADDDDILPIILFAATHSDLYSQVRSFVFIILFLLAGLVFKSTEYCYYSSATRVSD